MATLHMQSATGMDSADILKWKYLGVPGNTENQLVWHRPASLSALRRQDAAKQLTAVVSNVLPDDARTCDHCFPIWGNA